MRFSFFKKRDLIGLDIGSGAVKIVQVEKSRRGYTLVKAGMKEIDPEAIIDGRVLDAGKVVEAVKSLLTEHGIQVKDVAISVSGHSVIIKRLTLPVMKLAEVGPFLHMESERYIPFGIDAVNLDYHVLGTTRTPEGGEQMDVLLAAVKKDKLSEYVGVATEAGLNPVVVDVDAFAITNMVEAVYDNKPEEVVALINLGSSVMGINILRGKAFIFTRDIAIGSHRYSEALQRTFGLSYEQAELAKRMQAVEGIDMGEVMDIVNGLHQEISAEVLRSFEYFKATTESAAVHRVLLSGGGAKLSGLIAHLSEQIGTPVEAINPFRKVQVPKSLSAGLEEIAPLMAVGMGLAIRTGRNR